MEERQIECFDQMSKYVRENGEKHPLSRVQIENTVLKEVVWRVHNMISPEKNSISKLDFFSTVYDNVEEIWQCLEFDKKLNFLVERSSYRHYSQEELQCVSPKGERSKIVFNSTTQKDDIDVYSAFGGENTECLTNDVSLTIASCKGSLKVSRSKNIPAPDSETKNTESSSPENSNSNRFSYATPGTRFDDVQIYSQHASLQNESESARRQADVPEKDEQSDGNIAALDIFAQDEEQEMAVNKSFEQVQHKCPYCDYKTNELNNLKRHMDSHYSTRKFICEICGAGFHAKRTMEVHVLYKHSNSRPFKCDFERCNAAFKVRNNLNRHSKVHSSTKSYSCEQCDIKFSSGYNLRRHMVIIHNDDLDKPSRKRVRLIDAPKGLEYAKGIGATIGKPTPLKGIVKSVYGTKMSGQGIPASGHISTGHWDSVQVMASNVRTGMDSVNTQQCLNSDQKFDIPEELVTNKDAVDTLNTNHLSLDTLASAVNLHYV